MSLPVTVPVPLSSDRHVSPLGDVSLRDVTGLVTEAPEAEGDPKSPPSLNYPPHNRQLRGQRAHPPRSASARNWRVLWRYREDSPPQRGCIVPLSRVHHRGR